MKFPKNIALNIMAAASMTLMLSACGSGDTASSSSSTGSLNLNITDAPVDTAQSVVVEFSGVELKPAEGKAITFDFTKRCDADPASCQIDLLALNGGISAKILADETVPAGKYNWLRLMVQAEENVKDSYIVTKDGGVHELSIPSSAQTGLKLNRSFVVAADGESNFTIDFDLRKSVHKTGKGEYILRPTLRMVDHTEMGSLSGNIAANLISEDCTTGAAVYVFPADTAAPDDEDGEAEDSGPDPITSAVVDTTEGVYIYKVSFLTAGDYLIAFTCDADLDETDEDDANEDKDIATVSFLSTATVSITVDHNTVHDFQ